MILYYLGLSRWAKELGGDVLTVETRGRYERGVSLDWAESVATLGDGASLFHTHDPQPMRDVLQQTVEVDLVIADHGRGGCDHRRRTHGRGDGHQRSSLRRGRRARRRRNGRAHG